MSPHITSPLFLHPFDGHGSLAVQEKLFGAQNYRSWRRAWDTCNNMVISWLMSSVSESIAKSIMFIGQPISEYYTKMNCVWEELDSMNVLPRITIANATITTFLNVINTQKEEHRLFQFLNGLDEHFSTQRSQLLLTSPLPNVETRCALLHKANNKEKCSICGYKWHPVDKCWEKIGYPPWHYKYKQNQQKNKGKNMAKQGTNLPKRAAAVAATESSSHIINSAEIDDELDNEYVAGIPWYTCLSSSKIVIHGWIIDTGATDHMTPNATEVFKQAIQDKEWCLAMNDELRALELNEDKKNARLVISSNRQRKGVDYKETFAPVAKMVTVRALLAVAAMNNLDVCQIDVSNAFLHGDL
ncbi:serine carboxypeptidase S28 family protein [Tanacetum coccineum]